jgi:hypothetical protein
MAKKGKKRHAEALRGVLDTLTLRSCDFTQHGANDLPITEADVNDFIKSRIRNWLESWVKPNIQEAIDFLERD